MPTPKEARKQALDVFLKAAGLKWKDVAIRLEVDPSTISDYVNGNQAARPERALKIDEILNAKGRAAAILVTRLPGDAKVARTTEGDMLRLAPSAGQQLDALLDRLAEIATRLERSLGPLEQGEGEREGEQEK